MDPGFMMPARSLYRSLSQRMTTDLPGLFSLLLFFSVSAFLFRSIEFGLIITASLGFHELGHSSMLAIFGLKSRIAFGPVGAYTWSSLPERARISQAANLAVHLAGPVFSLLLALLALIIHYFWKPSSDHLLILANFSAQVCVLNLLPMGRWTDGGKSVQRLAQSLEGGASRLAVFLPFTLSAVILTVYSSVWLPRLGIEQVRPYLLSLFLIGLWLAGSLFLELRLAGPQPIPAARPMTPVQGFISIFAMWDIMVYCLVVITVTPFWLRAEYVLGYLENLFLLYQFLTSLFV